MNYIMNKEEILETLNVLAKSQGFYRRLLFNINENPKILDMLEQQKFKDALDLVFFLEQ